MNEYRRLKARVSGRVQGVAYRASLQKVARARSVSGWVRNLAGGEVAFALEGDPLAVDAVLDWARQGPRWGRVESLVIDSESVDEAVPPGAPVFEIRR